MDGWVSSRLMEINQGRCGRLENCLQLPSVNFMMAERPPQVLITQAVDESLQLCHCFCGFFYIAEVNFNAIITEEIVILMVIKATSHEYEILMLLFFYLFQFNNHDVFMLMLLVTQNIVVVNKDILSVRNYGTYVTLFLIEEALPSQR